jgi:hypothetical protein
MKGFFFKNLILTCQFAVRELACTFKPVSCKYSSFSWFIIGFAGVKLKAILAKLLAKRDVSDSGVYPSLAC